MKKSIGLWQFFGFAVTSLGGTLLHFLYDWLGGAILIAPFSAVNESTWEHMKLFFFPTFVFALIESLFLCEKEDFWCIKLRGICLGLIAIPIIFYTCNGAIGKLPDWFNIAIFFISSAAAYLYETALFKKKGIRCENPRLSLTLLFSIAALFVIFTFYPPKIEIFRDPVSSSYGIVGS